MYKRVITYAALAILVSGCFPPEKEWYAYKVEQVPVTDAYFQNMALKHNSAFDKCLTVQEEDDAWCPLDGWEFAIHKNSTSEQYVNLKRFHAPMLNDDYEIRPLAYYRRIAEQYIIDVEGLTRNDFEYYDRGLYRFAIADIYDYEIVEDRPYQLSLYYRRLINGTATVGGGGGIIIHMKPNAEMVSYEKIWRPIDEEIKLEKPLKEEDEARAEALEVIAERELNVQDFVNNKTEFGYLEVDRFYPQPYIAPAYVFYFEPKQGLENRKKLEIVIFAVNDVDIAKELEDWQNYLENDYAPPPPDVPRTNGPPPPWDLPPQDQ